METQPHPLLASEDDEEYMISSLTSLPILVDAFFSTLEEVYIGNKTEKTAKASALHLVIRERLIVLSSVPPTAFKAVQTKPVAPDQQLPVLLRRFAGVFIRDVVSVKPQALTWKKPVLRLAEEIAEQAKTTRILFPLRMTLARQMSTFRSLLWTVLFFAFCVVELCCVVVLIIVPAVGAERHVAIAIGSITAALLLLFGGLLMVQHYVVTKALFVFYQRTFVQRLVLGQLLNSNSNPGMELLTSRPQGTAKHVRRGKHTRNGYYTIPYASDIGYIEGKHIDSQVVMIGFDSNYCITHWNNAAEVMTGFLAHECLRKPLSDLVSTPSDDTNRDIEAFKGNRGSKSMKIKLRAFAMAPVALHTVAAPIVDAEGEEIGWILICANAKDNLQESRIYLHNYMVGEMRYCLTKVLERRMLSHEDAVNVKSVARFAQNAFAANAETAVRAMVTDWEWTTVEQLLGRSMGCGTKTRFTSVDPAFPPTMCINPSVSNVVTAALQTAPAKCNLHLQILMLTEGVFSFSVAMTLGKSSKQWDFQQLLGAVRPLLSDTYGLLLFITDRRVQFHFPCQVAMITDDTDGAAGTAMITPSLVNCTVNVVTLISNQVDQHNISMLLLKTMFVSLTNVRDRRDLEKKILTQPCDVDVIICDRLWLSQTRDILQLDHGAIVIPITSSDADAAPSTEYEYQIRIPLVGNELQLVMTQVGSLVAAKKSAITAKAEQERILTLRQDSPWTQGRLLGRGSYGAVYEATSDLTGGKMAVKMFYFAADCEESITQLLNEIKIMCSLNHPNIVHYFHCERKEARVNLFMELCDASLADAFAEPERIPPHLSVAQIIQQVVVAIGYLHSQGIIHRDVKPQNILLKGDLVKLTDFGTARQGDAAKGVQGTFRYMAPEVYRGQPHSTKCDIWSIGCLASELFGCPMPFMSYGNRFLLEDMATTEEMLAGLSCHPLVLDFLRQCFRVDPEQRPCASHLERHPLLSLEHEEEISRLPTIFDSESGMRKSVHVADSAFSVMSGETRTV